MAGKIRANVEEIKNILRRREMKFIGGFLLIIVIGLALWQGAYYFSPEARQHREAVEYFENLDEQYRNDTYGGETPEETLALFKQALEEENIELASKYFLPEDQKRAFKNIKMVAEKGNISQMISDLERLNNGGNISKDRYQFTAVKKGTNQADFTITLIRNNETNTWKLDNVF